MDSKTEGFNHREERFGDRKLEFDANSTKCRPALPIAPGVVPFTNSQVMVTRDGTVSISTCTPENPDGYWIDDVLSMLMQWIRMLHPDEFRIRAETCMRMAMWMLDDRANQRHGFSDSPAEKGFKRPDNYLPSLDQWIDIYNQATRASNK